MGRRGAHDPSAHQLQPRHHQEEPLVPSSDPLAERPPLLPPCPFFRSEHVRLVEQALIDAPADGMTGRQVWEATDRAVPENTTHLILDEMANKELVEREWVRPRWTHALPKPR